VTAARSARSAADDDDDDDERIAHREALPPDLGD
jgi:hypothetical protein